MRKYFLLLLAVCLIVSLPLQAETVGHFFSVARDAAGSALSSASVNVYSAGTANGVILYSDENGLVPKGNPFLTDSNGNYDFFVPPGMYKVVVSKVGVGTFTTDYISIGTQSHASFHEAGGIDEIDLGSMAGQLATSHIADGTIINDDISQFAAIDESKLNLDYPTHSNINDPTGSQKAALAGTAGAPSGTNKYVTSVDARLSDPRIPLDHAISHGAAGSDPITISQTQIASRNVGTDLTVDLEEETHHTEHENGGSDEISVEGLSGALADPQKVEISKSGISVGTRPSVNLIPGDNVSLTVADNSGSNQVDVTVAVPTPPGAYLTTKEGLTTISNPVSTLWFNSSQFNLDQSPVGQTNVNLDTSNITLGGDVTGAIGSSSVVKLNGTPIQTLSPNDGDVLVWQDPTGWTTTPGGIPTSILGVPMDTSGLVISNSEGSAGRSLTTLWDADNSQLYWGIDTPGLDFYTQSGITSYSFDAKRSNVVAGAGIVFTPDSDPSAGGDFLEITADLSALTVSADQLKGVNIDTTAPGIGEVMKYDGTKWKPSTDVSGGTVTSKEAGSVVTAITDTIDFGAGFDLTDSPAGTTNVVLDLSELSSVNANYLSDFPVVASSPASDEVLRFDGNDDTWKPSTDWYSVVYGFTSGTGSELTQRKTLHFLDDFDVTDQSIANSTYVGLADAAVDDDEINWGTGASQVSSDDVPEGSSNKFLSGTQKTDLTDGGDSTLHYHASDRSLANATGTLDATKVGNGLTDTQVNNDLTLTSSASIDGAAIKSGSVPSGRLGNVAKDFKSIVIPYPQLNTTVGNIYIPYNITSTLIAAKTVAGSGNCSFNVQANGVNMYASNVSVAAGSSATQAVSTPVASGSFISFVVGTCDASTTEITITYAYNID